MSNLQFVRPTIKAFFLYVLLSMIFVATIVPVFCFYLLYIIWRSIRGWNLWKFRWFKQRQSSMPKSFFTKNFSTVQKKELETINERRKYYELEATEGNDLCGISISGGGIRSATLGLGLMQSFISNNVMHLFDYMSTVSGGGYIGSCLTSLI